MFYYNYHKGGKNEITNRQRMESDTATMDRRDMADKTMRDNRIRNDELTKERRYRADKTMEDKRIRNDEMTTNRRRINDRNPWRAFAISLLLAVLVVGAYLLFF